MKPISTWVGTSIKEITKYGMPHEVKERSMHRLQDGFEKTIGQAIVVKGEQ